jgi:hypothetical protein
MRPNAALGISSTLTSYKAFSDNSSNADAQQSLGGQSQGGTSTGDAALGVSQDSGATPAEDSESMGVQVACGPCVGVIPVAGAATPWVVETLIAIGILNAVVGPLPGGAETETKPGTLVPNDPPLPPPTLSPLNAGPPKQMGPAGKAAAIATAIATAVYNVVKAIQAGEERGADMQNDTSLRNER